MRGEIPEEKVRAQLATNVRGGSGKNGSGNIDDQRHHVRVMAMGFGDRTKLTYDKYIANHGFTFNLLNPQPPQLQPRATIASYQYSYSARIPVSSASNTLRSAYSSALLILVGRQADINAIIGLSWMANLGRISGNHHHPLSYPSTSE